AAGAIPFEARRIDADALRRPGDEVAQEDVPLLVRVARHEVVRIAVEDDELAAACQRRVEAPGVRLGARGIDADARRRPRRAVADEDVRSSVRVDGNEVGRIAHERDPPSVRGNPGTGDRAAVLRLVAERVDADTLDEAARAVDDEYVLLRIRVAGNEIVGEAREPDEARVRSHRRPEAVAIALH